MLVLGKVKLCIRVKSAEGHCCEALLRQCSGDHGSVQNGIISKSTRWAPDAVINGVITPISRVITPVTHLQGHL